jgi:hypothetical protein
MLTKTKISDSKFYWITLSQDAEWGGKPRSAMHRYRVTGAIAKAVYDSCKTITPALISDA